MKKSFSFYRPGLMSLLLFLMLHSVVHAQTGNYQQTAGAIQSVNSWTPVTFTSTPLYAYTGTLDFIWIACHQPGFGSSTVNIEILTTGGYQNIGSFSNSLDCQGASQSIPLSGSVLSSAAQAGNGSIECRFQINDGCQAGVGCAAVNDPMVTGIVLTYPFSNAEFSANDTSVCPGNTVTFTASFPGAIISRVWNFPGGTPSSSTAASPVITYNTPGNYDVTLTITSAGGNDATTKTSYMTIFNAPPASVNAAGPVTFCSGGNVLLNANTGGGLTYKWKKNNSNISGATSSSYQASSSGNFKAVVTNSDGCSSTSNVITVTSNANPTAVISANGPVSFCPGGSVTLQAIPGGGFTYQWKKNGTNIAGATNTTYSATATGNYVCKITNGNGCSASSNTVAVTVNTPKATSSLVGSSTFCQGGSALLKANTGPGLTYQWFRNGATLTGATDSAYTVTVSGSYKVQVTNQCGSSNSHNRSITVNSLPQASVSAGGATSFCSGSTVTLNANTGTGLTYQWKKNGNNVSGATSASYVASTTGSFSVKITNASGCSATSNSIPVTVSSTVASITAGGPTTFCTGDSVVLSANTGTGLTYQWLKSNVNINGATANKYSAKTSGTYKVIVTNTNSGCAAVSNGIAVTVNCRMADAANEFKVTSSPNPFTDEVEISFENYSEQRISIEIYSIAGQLITRQEIENPQERIKMGRMLSPGIYTFKIIQGENIRTIKVIKN